MRMNNIALVLEGGGLRGMFSAGVFEAFLQKDLFFPYITAVSAGACNILSYMSSQPLRTRQIIQKYVTDPRYFGLRNLLKQGSIFGFDFMFGEMSKDLLPFDYSAFRSYEGLLEVGATDCRTGNAVWFNQSSFDDNFLPVRASASMPFLAPVVHYRGYELLDGGLTEPIPVGRALNAGYEKFVIVLTRNSGYYKKQSIPQWLIKLWYKKYPRLWEAVAQRPDRYNKQLALAEKLAQEGKAVIIRPRRPLKTGKLDAKPDKLLALHDHGTECGLEACEKINALLKR